MHTLRQRGQPQWGSRGCSSCVQQCVQGGGLGPAARTVTGPQHSLHHQHPPSPALCFFGNPCSTGGLFSCPVCYRLIAQREGTGEEVTLQLQKGQVLGDCQSQSLPCTYSDKHKVVLVVDKHSHSSYTRFHFGFHLQLQTFLQQCQLNTRPWDAKHCLARLSGADCDRLWLQLMLMRTGKVFCIE